MTSRRYRLTRVALVAGVLVSTATLLRAQAAQQSAAPPAVLALRSSSEQAKKLFREAIFQTQNIGGVTLVRRAIDSAVALDPTFTLARAYQVFTGPADAAARADALSKILGESGSAPPVEVLLVLYWRESAGGRAAAAAPVIRSVAELIPGDAEFTYQALNTTLPTKPLAEVASQRREFARKFPTHAMVHNALAYQLAISEPAAALTEAAEYVRLAPNHPNTHDTYADVLILQRRPADAIPHVQQELAIDSTIAGAYMKLGAIRLMQGDVADARTEFTKGQQRFPAPATAIEFVHWNAATYAATGDGKGAVRELTSILGMTPTAAQATVVHERLAAVEAFLGDRAAVAGHMTASETGTPPAGHFALKSVVYAQIGDLDGARAAAAQYTSMVPAVNQTQHTLRAFIALKANDMSTAGSELAGATDGLLLTQAVRADYLTRQGKKSEAGALKQQVMTSALKVDGNPAVDYLKVVARLYVSKL